MSDISIREREWQKGAWDVAPITKNSGSTAALGFEVVFIHGKSNWVAADFAENAGLYQRPEQLTQGKPRHREPKARRSRARGVVVALDCRAALAMTGQTKRPLVLAPTPDAGFPKDPADLVAKLKEVAADKEDQDDHSNRRADTSTAKAVLNQIVYHWVLGPQSEVPISISNDRNFPVSYTNGPKDFQSGFYYGLITYRDVFDPTISHETKFCFRPGFYVSNESDPSTFQQRLSPCEHWNCTDDECKADRVRADQDEVTQVALNRKTNKTASRGEKKQSVSFKSGLPLKLRCTR